MKITVLTATYNREHLLPQLYESINRNYESYSDFEWIIMDDGSVDDTKKIVSKWMKESKYKIEYHYQKNQGKMKAINNGLQYVNGDIVVEMDSDDYFLDDAFKTINEDYEKLNNEHIYGIIYKRKLIGKDNSVDSKLDGKIVKLFDLHNKYGYDFDMTLTFKADIRKKYQYQLEENEKFVTEARLYYKLDQIYEGLLFKDKELIVSEYMEDGYSKNINKMFKSYPYGYLEYFKECLSYTTKDTLFKKRIYFVKHYILFSYLTNKSMMKCIKEVKGINKLLVILLVIPGYIKSSRF